MLGRGRIQDCDGTAFTAQPSGWSTGKSPHKAVKKRKILKSCRCDYSFDLLILKVT